MGTNPRRTEAPALRFSHASHLKLACLLGVLYSLSVIQAQDVHSRCGNLTPSPTLTPFVQPLPIPVEIDISTGSQLTLGAYKISQSVHPDLPNTTFYGYGTSQDTATSPGPTLNARRNVASFIRFENHITDAEHILTVDKTLHRATPANGGVPMSVHLHGADAEGKFDGHPEAWFTAAGDKGPTFIATNNTYPNEQPASLLWYHDHTLGYTRLNVVSGLAGLYFIRGGSGEPGSLPEGRYEIPLVIQDKQFYPNGSINFPDLGSPLSPAHPQWCPDYFGDTILVNGKAWPFLDVVGAVYRFRILNAANARAFTLSFSDSRLQFVQIGTDGGYMWAPQLLQNLTMAPAYRVDVLVDFSSVPVGTTVYLNNTAPAPFPDGDPINSPPSTRHVMKFNVVQSIPGLPAQSVVIPTSIGSAPSTAAWIDSAVYRNVTLDVVLPPDLTFLLNKNHWDDPVTETPKLYTTEIWDIIHLIPGGIHPIHIHLINFLVLHQQAFDLTRFNGGLCSLLLSYPESLSCYTEAPQPPDATQVGWKDTVVVYPGTRLRILMNFAPRDWPQLHVRSHHVPRLRMALSQPGPRGP
ncbi:protein MpLPR3 [Marchantia polymorpha subsp. ruderalis]|uniref:Plastocyanin-like domain-containing protein n=3 Tax=Marchantia polymorpha TaxID=3197 RepID=A0A679DXU4_MARPO|nr:hypothetical protein AXG93_4476s1050 [Marchantia polymorpha subsp. ruderalis]PTQ47529.1 hypothetical protein MARPO_0008s0270 [Marchantia polymorpha]BBN20720.1 hypothetical protein Mp_zg00510 [Marchantia polymorpha subsp. ruderalis]|eukprot:PTQ47529.1 hypothetical protein MARPO_0008s0270 [Marchantia polymorpha]